MRLSTMAQLLTNLAYAYPNTKLPSDNAGIAGVGRVWVEALHGIGEEYIHAAVNEWIQNEPWFPSPSGIRHMAIRRQLGLLEENAAWTTAVKMVESRDAKVYQVTDGIVKATVRDVGGPKAFTEGTDMGRLRESFLRAYRQRITDVFKEASEDKALEAMGSKFAAITEGA